MRPRWRQSLQKLARELRRDELSLDPEVCARYSADKWFASHRPDAVALPRDRASVSTILRRAQQAKIPLTARGAGYGYVGSCVPNRGGIVLSLERMNRVKEINAADFIAVVEPGVITQNLQQLVEQKGMF